MSFLPTVAFRICAHSQATTAALPKHLNPRLQTNLLCTGMKPLLRKRLMAMRSRMLRLWRANRQTVESPTPVIVGADVVAAAEDAAAIANVDLTAARNAATVPRNHAIRAPLKARRALPRDRRPATNRFFCLENRFPSISDILSRALRKRIQPKRLQKHHCSRRILLQ